MPPPPSELRRSADPCISIPLARAVMAATTAANFGAPKVLISNRRCLPDANQHKESDDAASAQ